MADLEGRLHKIAGARHGSTALVERASDGNSAYLRFDIKRREVLTATIGSPLVDVIHPDAPNADRPTPVIPTALDLPDVDPPVITLPVQKEAATTSANGSKPAASSAPSDADDVSDWI
jgi:hypothetical protein